MKPQTAYNELVRHSREQALLASCIELVGWDELTQMPRGGVENRGHQLAYLSGLYHKAATHPHIGGLLDTVTSSPLVADAESDEAVNVREWRRLYERSIRLPRELVEELADVAATAQQAWANARQNSDFSLFEPWLENIVRLKQREAECRGHAGVAYDALIEDYEPGVTSEQIAALFEALRPELTGLLAEVSRSSRSTQPRILLREFPIDRQRIFAETAAADMGFDFERGRLDTTSHPFFSPIGPGDCRLTTRFNYNNFGDSFFAMLHEMGHGLYEQGLDSARYGLPCGEAMTMAIHESQARLWEKFIGFSRPFWQHFFPLAKEIFHDALHDVECNDFYRAVNHIQPGWNRVRADAVSYDLHILVRFELEQMLISGDLKAGDVPTAWNEKYRDYLGVTPANDAEGCLQDSHWASGQFGYFPTYTLGNVCAAQLFVQVRKDLPGLDTQLADGNFSDLLDWLRENIYRHGQRYPTAQLMERITGRPPDHQALIDSLRGKCGEVYGKSE
ncbi:MAG: carboxypeptidase M32 [Planctomycetota bacterium]|nr:carboxypeptidase M32 [Planctomycetota bacterium]